MYLWCISGGVLTMLGALLAGDVGSGTVQWCYKVAIVLLVVGTVLLRWRLVSISAIERVGYVLLGVFWIVLMALGLLQSGSPEEAWLSLSPTIIMGLNLQVVGAYLWFDTRVALWNALALPVASSALGGTYFAMNSGPNGHFLAEFVRFEVSLLIAVGFVHVLARSKDMLATTRMEAARMRTLAYRDFLTGLPNRRSALDELATRVSDGVPATVMIIDVDDFKRVNDSLGHQAGDAVLVTLAQILQECSGGCVLARWGGEEFLVVVDGSPETGSHTAERLRQTVEKATFPSGIHLTISVGATYFKGPANGLEAEIVRDTLRLADLELYRAKEQGRNRVSTHGPDEQLRRTALRP